MAVAREADAMQQLTSSPVRLGKEAGLDGTNPSHLPSHHGPGAHGVR